MDDVTDTPAHAKTRTRSRADVWFVLILTGGTSAFLQMWHATHSGSTAGVVDVLVGVVPAATAIGLSHVVVSHKAAVWLRVVTVGVMLAFMAAAASASAAVVQPVEVRDFNWVFSFALDVAELGCVWVLLGNSERKAAESAALQAAGTAATEAAESARESGDKAARLEAELAEVRTDLAAASAAFAALRQQQKDTRKSGRGSGPKRPASSPPNKRAASPPNTDAVSPPEVHVPEDVSTRAEALSILDDDPNISGSELGRRLGKSERYGCMLKASLVDTDAPATGEQPRVN